MTTLPGPLRLGPIVGHTDTTSSRVWICVDGPIDTWRLAVEDQPLLRFLPTDPDRNEFGTAIAVCDSLLPDRLYRYEVRQEGETVASGSFRTMPPNDSGADIEFVTLSCDDDREPNAWGRLAERIAERHPRFILMVGDQIYTDEGDDNLWQTHLDSSPAERRHAFTLKHEKLWAKEPIATIMANTPVYMTWDDHDIRDGWGSFAGDSPTLAAQNAGAAAIHRRYRAFFNDAADVYYHFQACRNPESGIEGALSRPFAFRCGRLLVVVLDSRSDRDFARPENPILGESQWRFIEKELGDLDADVDAIAVVTAVPIVDLDPEGKVHRFFAGRTDDVDKMLAGDAEGLDKLLYKRDNPIAGFVSLLAGITLDRDFEVAKALGFRVSDLDDMRDKWSYGTNRAEQRRLLETFARACRDGRDADKPRSLVFLGGDIHVGAIFDIDIRSEGIAARCVVTSGIAKSAPLPEVKGVLVDERFDVAEGIHASLRALINKVNFAETRFLFGTSATFSESSLVSPEEEQSQQ